MIYEKKLNFDELVGHTTILYGETNTKKTFYTSKFVQFLVESKKVTPKEITILDFAPPLNIINNLKIGGEVKDFYKNSVICNNIYVKGDIIPPRLKARSKKELYEKACNNFKKTYEILNLYSKNPTKILIINDISIYLHIGNKNLLLETISKSNTFFGNAYYGSSIKSDFSKHFSLREKRLVEYIIKKIEYTYFTG